MLPCSLHDQQPTWSQCSALNTCNPLLYGYFPSADVSLIRILALIVMVHVHVNRFRFKIRAQCHMSLYTHSPVPDNLIWQPSRPSTLRLPENTSLSPYIVSPNYIVYLPSSFITLFKDFAGQNLKLKI